MSPPRISLLLFARRLVWMVLAVVPLATLTAGCGSSTTTAPTAPTPPQGPADLQIIDLTVGDGDVLPAGGGSQGTLIFTYWVFNPAGTDSKGAAVQTGTIQLRPGLTNVLAGISQGVVGMMVHGKRRLIIPPSLAWGASGDSSGAIAPNAWVVFELELLEVRDCSVLTCQV
jgi:FKBP-type peptidyl-prolyl cis-trans isomerase FkpA